MNRSPIEIMIDRACGVPEGLPSKTRAATEISEADLKRAYDWAETYQTSNPVASAYFETCVAIGAMMALKVHRSTKAKLERMGLTYRDEICRLALREMERP